MGEGHFLSDMCLRIITLIRPLLINIPVGRLARIIKITKSEPFDHKAALFTVRGDHQ